ncbi:MULTISPECIES: hypothetical protein [Bacteroides]|uniref:hypothetical protein n=1 Tax=Bacteroides TaxID=816 RepID=UPI0025B61DCD|nr:MULTISPECIES: hypothetical protein [Bacteroides]
MNEVYEEKYFKVFYHFEKVPRFMQKYMREEFMKHRSEVVRIFQEHIDGVNDEWTLTGKEFAFGEYIEDINPEYSKLVYDRIQPFIDVANKLFPYCKYKIDEYCDIVGYLPFIRKSKLWISLKEIES